MSNLKLHSATTPNKLADFMHNRIERQLGYQTRVDQVDMPPTVGHSARYDFRIWHHATAIAFIGSRGVEVSNGGYDSATTRTRLNQILRDNGIPAQICQHQYVQCLEFQGVTYTDFRWAQFTLVAGVWCLTDGQYTLSTDRRE